MSAWVKATKMKSLINIPVYKYEIMKTVLKISDNISGNFMETIDKINNENPSYQNFRKYYKG